MRALLLLTLVACAKDKPWIETRATQLHVGSLEADIPAGWRDIHELADQSKLSAPIPRDGSRVLLPENLGEHAEILVFPLNATVKGDDCVKLGAVLEAQAPGTVTVTDAQSATFGGNPGCMMDTKVHNMSGVLRVVTPKGGSTVGIRCMGWAHDLEWACDKIVYGLHVTPGT